MSGLFAAWFGWFGLVVLFPFTVVVVVSALWRRMLCDEHGRLKQKPPYASISGFILCGWYGYLVVSFIVVFSNLVPFFNLANDPQIAQRQRIGVIFSILVGILCAFAGEFIASRLSRHFGRMRNRRFEDPQDISAIH